MSNKSTNPEKAKPPGGADLTCIILWDDADVADKICFSLI